MTEQTTQQVTSIPAGMHSITPHLVCAGAAKAIGFYKQAFGAVELGRMDMPDGRVAHAEISIGDSRIMLADAFPEHGSLDPLALKGSSVVLHLYVPDADAVFAQATAAGAKTVMPPSDMFWGDRYGQVDDPFGHRWAIATHQRDLTMEQMQQGLEEMMSQSTQGEPQ